MKLSKIYYLRDLILKVILERRVHAVIFKVILEQYRGLITKVNNIFILDRHVFEMISLVKFLLDNCTWLIVNACVI